MDLPGLGPKSAAYLREVGIHTEDDLWAVGPVQAYVKLLGNRHSMKPSLNFLYALVGAVEGVQWTKIAKHENGRLLAELPASHVFNNMVGQIED